jgi:hypothetical protein
VILELSARFIPKRTLKDRKTTHPWVNDRVVGLVREKRNAEGTEKEEEGRSRYSAGILEEYGKYIARERVKLLEMRRGAKGWWTKSRRLLQKKGTVSSIPALREEKQWVLDAKSKADLFVYTFSKKYKLEVAEINEYSDIEPMPTRGQVSHKAVTEEDADTTLSALRVDSGTGPDLLPAMILKNCAKQLARPVQLLTMLIVLSGSWPESWLVHWVVPPL